MGWWETVGGSIFGDEPADILDDCKERGEHYKTLEELPKRIRQRIVKCYLNDLGREPTEQELRDLIEWCREKP